MCQRAKHLGHSQRGAQQFVANGVSRGDLLHSRVKQKYRQRRKQVAAVKMSGMETNAGTYTSKVTYMDLVKEVSDLSPETLGLLIEFARVLRARRWMVTPQTPMTEVEATSTDAAVSGRQSYVAPNRVKVITFPAASLLNLVGLFNLEGDAVEDTERLYDGRD